jgi:hypothetical protein
LTFDFSGQSRWLSLETQCEWTDLSSAQQFQLGLYATVNRDIVSRAMLRLPTRDSKYVDQQLATFELAQGRRNVNRSGRLELGDFARLDTDRRPQLLLFFDTKDVSQLELKLNYVNVYFD